MPSSGRVIMLHTYIDFSVHCVTFQIKGKLKTWSDFFHEEFEKRDFNRAVEATQRMRYYERAVEETVKKL
jgi:hypothetical protein